MVSLKNAREVAQIWLLRAALFVTGVENIGVPFEGRNDLTPICDDLRPFCADPRPVCDDPKPVCDDLKLICNDPLMALIVSLQNFRR
jgi:hypothetical protein